MWRNYLKDLYYAAKRKIRRRKFGREKTHSVWKKEFGNKGWAKCPVCKKNIIDPGNFQMGHVIAHSKGGPDELHNFRPICKECNAKMRDTHWDEYVRKHPINQRTKLQKPSKTFWESFASAIFGDMSPSTKTKENNTDNNYLGDPYGFMPRNHRGKYRKNRASNYWGWAKFKFK